MTVNFCEQQLDQIWSNLGRDRLGRLILEQGAQIKQTALSIIGQQHIYA
jgi:hypothetical protein